MATWQWCESEQTAPPYHKYRGNGTSVDVHLPADSAHGIAVETEGDVIDIADWLGLVVKIHYFIDFSVVRGAGGIAEYSPDILAKTPHIYVPRHLVSVARDGHVIN